MFDSHQIREMNAEIDQQEEWERLCSGVYDDMGDLYENDNNKETGECLPF